MIRRKNRKVIIALAVLVLVGLAVYVSIGCAKKIIQKFNFGFVGPCPGCESSLVSPIIDPKMKAFGLEIEKLDILVPVVKNVDGKNKQEYNSALHQGVAHYEDTALPGEEGNIFIFGHSSSDVVPGENGKIFVRLNELEKGDRIKLYFEDQNFSYEVSENKIVEPTDLSVLDQTDSEILTLMTCWPLGTKDKRLVVVAEKISE